MLRARPNFRRLSIWLCLLGIPGALLASSSSALGARGHEFEKSFSEPCALEPCEGRLKEPSGVAVNEASGDVYVVDKGANRVARFSATGEYISEFDGSGEVELGGILIEGKAAGSGGLAGEIPTGRFEQPEGIAVDNSCTLRKLSKEQCEAEDPSSGDVYVVDAGHRVVDKYSPSGAYIGQITEAGGAPFSGEELDGVAVDTQGSVWVYRQEPVLDGFSNAQPNAFVQAISLSGQGLGFPPRGSGAAVDSENDFYVRSGAERAAKISPTAEVLIKELDAEPTSAVAVDQQSDDSFLDNLTSIRVSNPKGDEVERLGEERGEKHLISGAGVAVNAGAGESQGAGAVYVADAGAKSVVVFGQSEPQAPRVESESLTNVTSDSAELGAVIDPRSEVGEAPTEYHFQYGACAGSCQTNSYEASIPIPDGKIAAGFEAQAVGALLQGLKANTTYHFRVLAKNSHGQGAPGEEKTFTTQGLGGPLHLPDARGWELVSPPDKQGALIEPIAETGVVEASVGGNAISYLANAPIGAQPQGYTNEVQVLSRRGAGAWSSRDLAIPHSAATGLSVGTGVEYRFFNAQLTLAAVQPFGQFVPALSPQASESTAYLRDLSESCGAGCYDPLVTGKPGFANVPEGTVFGEAEACQPSATRTAQVVCGPQFVGASEDLSHVVLFAKAALTPGAGAGAEQLYEWSGGALAQLSVLPGPGGGSAPEGDARLGLENQGTRGAISSDGSRIDWSTPQALYQRESTRGETLQLDLAQAGCGECESGGGRFQFASADGSRVFFTDTNRLSKDSGASAEPGKMKADLYECQIVSEGAKQRCALSDLTPKRGEESAEVQGGLLGASEDGQYIYYVAKGVQSEAPNSRGQRAILGQPNLYLRHGSVTSFIATLAGGDFHDWEERLFAQPTRVSGNGEFLELMSEARLSGYDNRDVKTNAPAAEVYIYDASSAELSCASCEPSGARPVGVEYRKLEPGSGGLVGGGRGTWRSSGLVAANVAGWTAIGSERAQLEVRHQPRYLNDSGRLFFNSVNALEPQDANATQDVYEYEPPGVGDCSQESASYSARSGGCVSLISSGGSSRESAFLDASQSGDDVFFLTAARLSALDSDAALDVYDAHVCSSALPCIKGASEQAPPCSSEASCKAPSTSQPSIFGAPASATFSGPGNAAPSASPPAHKLTRAEQLAKALKACHAKKDKQKRKACERAARKRYGSVKKAKKKAKAKTRKR